MRLICALSISMTLFLSGCNSSDNDYIISAVGSYGDVAIITSSEQTQLRVSSTLNNISNEEVFVLKKEETLNLRYFPVKRWKDARNYRNVIVAVNWSDGGQLQGLVKNMIPEHRLAKMLNGSGGLIKINDPWLRNQIALIAVANSASNLNRLLENQCDIISREIDSSNNTRIISDNRKRGIHKDIVDKYKKHLGLSIEFPLDYRQNQINPDGFKGVEWIIPGPPTRGISLSWIETENCSRDMSDQNFLADSRAELGEYLHSEKIVKSSLEWGVDTIAGYDAISLSGSWVSSEVGVGGPFKCYFIANPNYSQIICIDLLVYAPDKEKVDYFRKMRAIIETLIIYSE
jgi:hypothetical protein